MENQLINKLKNKEAVIGILGMGYVGLPLALGFAEAGFHVLGFDIDESKVEALNAGRSYIQHIPGQRVKSAVEAGLLEAVNDFEKASEADALIICVPTPLNSHREPDLSFVTGTLDSILPHLREGQIISLESTTYPGTTEEVLRPKLEYRRFNIGEDFFLVYSPEREDPGNPDFHIGNIPKVCGGTTEACAAVGKALYEAVVDKVVMVSSTQAAELTKLLENIYRAVNIGLVNELKIVADAMGLDIREVVDAAATKPFGFTPFYPGPGLGGHCIPIDPFYLTWKAREFGLHTRFIELAGEINHQMPDFVIRKTMDALNEHGKAMKGATIIVLGLAYKKNVADLRESPAVKILEILDSKGALVKYSDPHVPVFPSIRKVHFDLKSEELTPQTLAAADVVMIVTDHDAFDYSLILKHSNLIIDTRGIYNKNHPKVFKA